jgi:hypothetical protein
MIILTFGLIVFNFIFLVNRIVLLFCAFVLQEKQQAYLSPRGKFKIAQAVSTGHSKKQFIFG